MDILHLRKMIGILCISALFLVLILPAATAIGGGQGWITVRCNVDGATVLFDGQYEGIISGGSLTVPVYTTGAPYSTVTVQQAGYTTYSGPLTMPAEGETTTTYATLNPLYTPVPVNYGTLYVDSAPSGAEIYINGNYRGLSPLTVSDLWPGQYSVEADKSGYQSYSTTTSVSSGTRSNVYCPLSRLDTSGALYVISDPSHSNVYLDAVYRGTTPLTLSNLASGTHILQIDHADCYDWKSTVTVPAGGTKTISATLNPMPSSSSGWIYVTSSPGGAAVTLDGSVVGQTPVTGSLKLNAVTTGMHTITLSLAGYQQYSQSVSVSPNTVSEVSAVLSSQSSPATNGGLAISSTPAGANIFVDNNFVGITPATLNSIPTGMHTITLKEEGYADYTTTTPVNAGATSTISAALLPVTPAPKSPLPLLTVFGAICGAGLLLIRKKA